MTENRANLEIIAPSIEEAVEEGLEKLGLPEDAVEIEVLDEGNKGLFGLGSRQARIRITVKSDGDQLDEAQDIEDDQADEPDTTRSSPVLAQTDDEVLTIARGTVSELLEKMKVSAEVKAYYGEPDDDRSQRPIHVDIQGKDLSILIGRKAETLEALQFITKLIAGKELERSIPISVDVEGYRKRRERQIRKLAVRLAEQVSETGRSQSLESMPPNERRLVHIELRNDPLVYTESTGDGARRKVVIYPKD
jgi:spoIIIJ-associated protein